MEGVPVYVQVPLFKTESRQPHAIEAISYVYARSRHDVNYCISPGEYTLFSQLTKLQNPNNTET